MCLHPADDHVLPGRLDKRQGWRARQKEDPGHETLETQGQKGLAWGHTLAMWSSKAQGPQAVSVLVPSATVTQYHKEGG